jgi:hypothetical protein
MKNAERRGFLEAGNHLQDGIHGSRRRERPAVDQQIL